jgi:tRNA-modifying protein YgfZ
MTPPFLFETITALSDLGLIHAQGPDAVAFLQSQLTNEVAMLPLTQARLAGYCSPKGRLLASFVVYKTSEQDVHLICSQDLLASTLKRLSMFVLRARCTLHDASAEFHLLGGLGGGPESPVWGKITGDQAHIVRLPDGAGSPRFLWVTPVTTPIPALAITDMNAWHLAEVQSAVARIQSANVECFVPQMINHELLGGVDFKKGCYPGQEVVARSQYRGTTKRRALLFTVEAQAVVGQELFHSEEPAQPAGVVVHCARQADQKTLLLAEVKWAALSCGRLHLGQITGPLLNPSPMPYEVPQLEA